MRTLLSSSRFLCHEYETKHVPRKFSIGLSLQYQHLIRQLQSNLEVMRVDPLYFRSLYVVIVCLIKKKDNSETFNISIRYYLLTNYQFIILLILKWE